MARKKLVAPHPDAHDPLTHSPWRAVVPALAAGEHVSLLAQVAALRAAGQVIFPAQGDIFRALELTSPESVRVVILGQDPYHGAGQAHGLSFSVPPGVPCPRSLANIFKEIHRDIAPSVPPALLSSPQDRPVCDLTRWARQGVLLLNTVLTVEEGKAHAHAALGWQNVTRSVLAAVAAGPAVAVLLWGKPAQSCAPLFAQGGHLVLEAAHPSPLSASRGFHGCGHFSKVNAWLKARGEAEICW